MEKAKKILILGGNNTEKVIVERAHALGYYTIVTDNHEDWTLSPAKQIADEGWNISWSDIDTLEKRCIEVNVNGVLAGFSEFRVENMIKLCERLHLPCSLTIHQLDVTRDKELFKKTCREYNIPTIAEYNINDVRIYPVIVKPVDRGGSIGINVARNPKELKEAYEYAISLSPAKRVIIEDFIEDGTKFDVYYYVKGKDAFFLGCSDTIMCKGNVGAKILQKGWPFKSKYEQQYLEKTDALVKRMFRGLGVQNAYATLSAFYVNGDFYFFETGFRLSGEMSFNYYEYLTGINYVDSMLKYAMGCTDISEYKEIKDSSCTSIVLNFFLSDGKIKNIDGLDKLNSCPFVYSTNVYMSIGDVIKNNTNVFKKGLMVTIMANTQKEIRDTVSFVNNSLKVIDTEGKSMIYECVGDSELIHYYKK